MRNLKISKVLKVILVITGFALSIILLQDYQLNPVLAEKNPSSYPIIKNLSKKELLQKSIWDGKSDTELGFDFKYPNSLSTNRYNRKIGNESINNITSISNNEEINTEEDLVNIEIIPIKTFKKSTALETLESYIVSYVGIIEKNNQKTFQQNDFDIAQIGYNPFADDGENYFRVYTLLQKGNRAWIITIGYFTDYDQSDSLNMTHDYKATLYQNIIDNFQSESKYKDSELNVLDISKVDKNWIKEYHKNNSKFITNI